MQGFSLASAWDQAVQNVDLDEIGPAYAAFLKMIKPLGDIEGTILLAVPNDFTKTFVETRLSAQLTSALAQTLNREVRIAITVDPSLEQTDTPDASESEVSPHSQPSSDWDSSEINSDFETPLNGSPQAENLVEGQGANFKQHGAGTLGGEMSGAYAAPFPHFPPGSAAPTGLPSYMSTPHGGLPAYSNMRQAEKFRAKLNPKYTFDTFVIGPSNRFAHAAALAVAEAPARAYNPLFIYGDSGLGKTHLLHAIGHYALSLYPNLRVTYVNSEEFTNAFINAIMEGSKEKFKRRYRETDILLIDDIQFIQDKKETVEEFFHTFNALHDAGKQIVITSDLPPKALSRFEERLRSRFQSGLTTDVQPPDLETRIAILQMKATSEGIEIDHDVLAFIASRISANIRELEGSLLRVTAFAHLTNQTIDLRLATMVLKDVLSDPEDTEISVSLIMGQTASFFDVTIEQLCSSDRSRPIVEARQIAMYLCRNLTDLSLPKIGEAFGGRDHTTVMYANKKIGGLMTERRETYNHVTELTNRIKRKAREG